MSSPPKRPRGRHPLEGATPAARQSRFRGVRFICRGHAARPGMTQAVSEHDLARLVDAARAARQHRRARTVLALCGRCRAARRTRARARRLQRRERRAATEPVRRGGGAGRAGGRRWPTRACGGRGRRIAAGGHAVRRLPPEVARVRRRRHAGVVGRRARMAGTPHAGRVAAGEFRPRPLVRHAQIRSLRRQRSRAAQSASPASGRRPRIAVLLGSGWQPFADRVRSATRLAYAQLPAFPALGVGATPASWCSDRSVPEVAMLAGRKHT